MYSNTGFLLIPLKICDSPISPSDQNCHLNGNAYYKIVLGYHWSLDQTEEHLAGSKWNIFKYRRDDGCYRVQIR